MRVPLASIKLIYFFAISLLMYVVLRDKMPQMCVVGEASITDICGCIDFALLVPSNRGIEWHGVYLVAKIASIIYDRQRFSTRPMYARSETTTIYLLR